MRALKFAKHANVYTVGDNREQVYFIESGEVRIAMLSSVGKECLLAIPADGDVFGERRLSGLVERLTTATAIKATRLKQTPCSKLFLRLTHASLLEGFGKYQAVTISDQQKIITQDGENET